VFLRNIQVYLNTLPILILLICFTNKSTFAADEESLVSLTNFSFANYLGTGFYTTSGQDVFVIQFPLQHIIKEKTDSEAGWVLNLPLTIGFINFDDYRDVDIENLPKIDDVATLTFLPGIEYQIPMTADWTITPFADYGFARDFNFKSNVLITAIGIKSYANFHLTNTMFSLGNRFLYVKERSKDASSAADYSLIETGLNYRVTSDRSFKHGPLYSNLYYINFYYPNNLVFLESTENPVRVGIEHEVGITFSNLPDFLFLEKPQIGLGLRFGNGVNVYRIVFGAPF